MVGFFEELEEEELVLMRPYVHAFVLRSRQCVTARTRDIHEVVFENSFNDVVLPPGHKANIQALVRTHGNSRESESFPSSNASIEAALDLVKVKGSGLIILLHGPPGVGKTSRGACSR